MTANKHRTVRNTIIRLGDQAKPKDVVAALENYGVEVSEAFVAQVQRQMIRDEARVQREQAKRPPKSQRRKRPQTRKIPRQR